MEGGRWEDAHRDGWDPGARLVDQDRDGIMAEVVSPTIGMVLCNHGDIDYKQGCFDAYNLWMVEHMEFGQTLMRREIRRAAEASGAKPEAGQGAQEGPKGPRIRTV